MQNESSNFTDFRMLGVSHGGVSPTAERLASADHINALAWTPHFQTWSDSPRDPLRGIFPDEDARTQKISSIPNLTLAPTRAIFPGCIADSSICLNTLLMSFSLKETCQEEVDLFQGTTEHRGFFQVSGSQNASRRHRESHSWVPPLMTSLLPSSPPVRKVHPIEYEALPHGFVETPAVSLQ